MANKRREKKLQLIDVANNFRAGLAGIKKSDSEDVYVSFG